MTAATDSIPNSRQALLDAVEAHVARTGLTRTGFGLAALGDASFLDRLARGSDLRLRTADRVLAFLGEEALGPRFRRELAAFIGVTRTKAYVLGLEATGDPSFVARLRRGRSPTLATVDRVTGDGPAFHRFGNRVRYLRADVEAWAAARRMTSTSDDGARGRRAA